jgi:thymidine phosphorylase
LLDKHSTGGIGDKVSLVLAPMLVACGAYVPMISGRGLGHTGGTLDKLEAIPGYRTQLDESEFQRKLKDAGCAIIGAGQSLAPADRRLYAVRDVTATVESVPLITASILSKKLAASLDGLVLDVKTGTGAFAATNQAAKELGQNLVTVANAAGLPTVALITDMNQVLGRTAGNAVEVAESIEFLCETPRDARLEDVVLALGSEALRLGQLVDDDATAQARLRRCLDDGSAAEHFANMVTAQGGPRDLLTKPQAYLPKAKIICPVLASKAGTVRAMDVRAIGLAIVTLGGGRHRPTDRIDASVGLTDIVSVGESVSANQPMAFVHAASDHDAEVASTTIREAITIGETEVLPSQTIVDRITTDSIGPKTNS